MKKMIPKQNIQKVDPIYLSITSKNYKLRSHIPSSTFSKR